MTARRLGLLVTLFVLLSASAQAAGTVTLTSATDVGGVTRYTYAWLSTAGGAVSGDTTTIALRAGMILKVALVPGSGGTQPSDAYDVTLLDTRSVDVLSGIGANLSNAASTLISDTGFWADLGETLQLTVANAGSAKQGQIILWVGR